MTGQNSFWFANPSTGFYPETIDQSLRFDGGGDLRKSDFSTPTDNQNWTWSAWIKLGAIDSGLRVLFQADTNSVDVLQTNANKLNLGINGTTGNTTALYRDPSAWYHVLFNYNGSNAYLYVNNRLDLTLSPSGNSKINNSSYTHFIGQNGSNSRYWSGYMAEVNFIDGQALDPTSFGESKNGVWIPKDVSSLTYGNNGFRLQFGDSGALGDDTSSNTNDFTVAGTLASTDVVIDSPSNNFSVLNRIDAQYGTFSEGNLKDTYATTGELIRSTFASKTGKWYAEVNCISGSAFNLGIFPTARSRGDSNYGCQYRGATGQKVVSNVVSSYGATYGVNDIIGIAVDMDNNTVTFYKNNSSQGSISYTIDEHHAFSSYIASGNVAFWNFGQDSTFGGNETRQSNTDANGIGDFYYSPPSGYLALCSSNLPDTTLSPNQDEQATDYFNTVLYTGNATDDREVTGVGFKPDWGWFKERDDAVNHLLFDSSRGASQQLRSNDTSAESTQANKQKTFTNDGYTLGTDGQINGSSDTYVVWNWKANGGTTSSNTDGTITSTVQASTESGFSIVTYTGTGTSTDTVGHGLGAKPKMVIVKSRSEAQNWHVYHEKLDATAPENYILPLNASNAKSSSSSTFWGGTAPTTTVMGVGSDNSSNKLSTTYVMYLFAEIEGYSKFGTYTGNGNADGTFVYLGFRPSFIMGKRTDVANYWYIIDNARDTFNQAENILDASGSTAEANYTNEKYDLLSNGFKLRGSGVGANANGGTYIYMAFAEQPFQFSNAR